MSTEGDRWFQIEQDRKRDRARLRSRAHRRAAKAVERKGRPQIINPNIKMTRTEWTYDEFGNLSRMVYGETK